jgi:tRNA threonylcarbamoyladenosine biosynthesis protein TsaB
MKADYTLAVEAATSRGSVALLRGLEVLVAREVMMRADDEDRLMPAVAACCDEAGVAPRDLARVVCGTGPGSFTSLRIAASIAKGTAAAIGCDLYAVSSLALTVAASAAVLPKGRYLSVLDAYRNEVFALEVELTVGGEVRFTEPMRIVRLADLESVAAEAGARVIGPGQEVDVWPRAEGVSALLTDVLAVGSVDLVSWEPNYGRAPEAQVRWEKAHGQSLPLQA